jgi:hypothetical protein
MAEDRKYVARMDNVYFLKHLGKSLREATACITQEDLPEDVRLALRRLERHEFLQNRPAGKAVPTA